MCRRVAPTPLVAPGERIGIAVAPVNALAAWAKECGCALRRAMCRSAQPVGSDRAGFGVGDLSAAFWALAVSSAK
jgi:hypothetical protein